MSMTRAISASALTIALLIGACTDDIDPGASPGGSGGSSSSGTGGSSSGTGGSSSGTGGSSSGTAGSGGEGGSAACPAGQLGQELGKDRLLIGGSMDDDAFGAAPFDLRYAYVAGSVPADGPCASCASGCYVNGASCANSEGCEWWGCWQWDQEPPGRYVANLVAETAAAGAIPMITYYIWFSVAGYVEGPPEIAALTDGARVAAYLDDFRFLCQVMAEPPAPPAMVHVEPDLWGYGHQLSADPSTLAVALSAAGASECSGLPDSLAGLAQCLLAIARDHAPNVRVGFHASAWGAGADALINTDPAFDVAAHAQQTAAYMTALGTGEADFVVVEMSDRDAGYNDRWWDETNQSLPSFNQAVAWTAALGQALNLAPLWWQIPYGHLGLENICDRYEDNRLDYIFDNAAQFAAGGALGVAFGAGAGCMTTPATDDGHFVARATAYYSQERPLLCGP